MNWIWKSHGCCSVDGGSCCRTRAQADLLYIQVMRQQEVQWPDHDLQVHLYCVAICETKKNIKTKKTHDSFEHWRSWKKQRLLTIEHVTVPVNTTWHTSWSPRRSLRVGPHVARQLCEARQLWSFLKGGIGRLHSWLVSKKDFSDGGLKPWFSNSVQEFQFDSFL